MEEVMMKESIETILSETDGNLIYVEQMISILKELGYSTEESCVIRKIYGKKYLDKINNFETKLKDQVGEELAKFIITKFRRDSSYAYYKCHEDAC